MEIGIIGLPGSGKSTLFEIMTGVASRDVHNEPCTRGQATVPDPRFDRLVEIYKPAKQVPAKVPFLDAHAAGEKVWNTIRQTLSGADGLVHIIDGFTTGDVADCVEAYRKLEDELVLSDLMVVENRLERLRKMSKPAMKPDDIAQLAALPRLQEGLEKGSALRDLAMTAEEQQLLRSFSFWTVRPELVVINTAEGAAFDLGAFDAATGLQTPSVGVCCSLEREISALPREEQKEYLDALGIAEPAFSRVIRAAFVMLNRMVFFTVGPDEVRAWDIPAGSKAPRAAGAIHKDLERGFIRAEVVGYDDFVAHGESMAAVKAAGRFRLEGKEYVVKDGDILEIRFNV